MHWKVYDSIRALSDLWRHRVTRDGCTTSPEFLAALEGVFPCREHLYFVAYEDESESDALGCAMLCLLRHDLSLELPPAIRRVAAGIRRAFPRFLTLKMAMTGTLETYGEHFWVDESRVGLGEFLAGLRHRMHSLERAASVTIFRDFIAAPGSETQLEHARRAFAREGFEMGGVLPVARLEISEHSTPEDYLLSLKNRDRYTIRKARRNAEGHGVAVKFVENYEPLIDVCYPLFLAVNARASELVTEPLPCDFFHAVKREFGPGARMLIARDAHGKLIAFALVLELDETMEIFAAGMDYDKIGEIFSMYNLLWECISEAIRNRRLRVDLGVTNYFIKQRFGARVDPMKVFFKASNPILGKLLRSAFTIADSPR